MAATLAPIAHIRHELQTQDNACTAHPLYVVFNRRRIHGMDPEFGDSNYDWIDSNSGDYVEADEHQKLVCDRYERIYGQSPTGWDKRYFIEVEEFVTCAFTREAADRFVARKYHDYRHLHVYVESLYRMPEMIAVREALIDGRFSEVA